MAKYYIEPHSTDYPHAQWAGKSSFYVNFKAEDGSESGLHYYEVESQDSKEIVKILESVANDFETNVASGSAKTDDTKTEAEISGLTTGSDVEVEK